MKIIAISQRSDCLGDQFIVEASEEELCAISGCLYKVHGYGGTPRVHVGTEVKVGDAWRIVVEHRESSGRLAGVAKTLHALADLCMQQDPILVVPEKTPQEGKVEL